jgi:hypothetical protein
MLGRYKHQVPAHNIFHRPKKIREVLQTTTNENKLSMPIKVRKLMKKKEIITDTDNRAPSSLLSETHSLAINTVELPQKKNITANDLQIISHKLLTLNLATKKLFSSPSPSNEYTRTQQNTLSTLQLNIFLNLILLTQKIITSSPSTPTNNSTQNIVIGEIMNHLQQNPDYITYDIFAIIQVSITTGKTLLSSLLHTKIKPQPSETIKNRLDQHAFQHAFQVILHYILHGYAFSSNRLIRKINFTLIALKCFDLIKQPEQLCDILEPITPSAHLNALRTSMLQNLKFDLTEIVIKDVLLNKNSVDHYVSALVKNSNFKHLLELAQHYNHMEETAVLINKSIEKFIEFPVSVLDICNILHLTLTAFPSLKLTLNPKQNSPQSQWHLLRNQKTAEIIMHCQEKINAPNISSITQINTILTSIRSDLDKNKNDTAKYIYIDCRTRLFRLAKKTPITTKKRPKQTNTKKSTDSNTPTEKKRKTDLRDMLGELSLTHPPKKNCTKPTSSSSNTL